MTSLVWQEWRTICLVYSSWCSTRSSRCSSQWIALGVLPSEFSMPTCSYRILDVSSVAGHKELAPQVTVESGAGWLSSMHWASVECPGGMHTGNGSGAFDDGDDASRAGITQRFAKTSAVLFDQQITIYQPRSDAAAHAHEFLRRFSTNHPISANTHTHTFRPQKLSSTRLRSSVWCSGILLAARCWSGIRYWEQFGSESSSE